MSGAALEAHLKTGLSSVARCWAVTRKDGLVLGFTDHDQDLSFDDVVYKAETGLTASALQQTTGLSVDNSEATGGLSSDAIREADIAAGRYDGAEVKAWLVNWANVTERLLRFRGSLGEIRRDGTVFHAELRGLSEALNHSKGRAYQSDCSAVLGDKRCGVDLNAPGFLWQGAVEIVDDKVFAFAAFDGFDDRWFERGRLRVVSGEAVGLSAVVKNDRLSGDGRRIEIWESLRANVQAGDMIRLEAGCDKRISTCRLKFNNILNFQGFPSIPGEDWLMAVPVLRARSGG
ncbi:MAG: DUF2163 domain-containing protein [Deltaproteobacteria bacterium]